ncbi:MAG: hypothetical protein ACYTG1_09950 [Planctomycetota bacterium]|jgi:uncharacterized membrane protein YphA (DoxX/SURF4 family)
MRFSAFAGTAIVPTLGRLVLGAAFLTAGYHKVFQSATYTADEAATLGEIGVTAEPIGGGGPDVRIVPASLDPQLGRLSPQDEDPPAEDEADAPAPEEETTEPPAEEPPAEDDAGATPPDPTDVQFPEDVGDLVLPADDMNYTAPAMHKVALIVHERGWKYPVWQGRVLAFTELIGGGLLLLGLFSRIWGLGLAIAMGTAFYLTSMPLVGDPGLFGLVTRHGEFNQVYAQLGLFVLAFGVFVTGAGPVSFDRLLFRRGSSHVESPDHVP